MLDEDSFREFEERLNSRECGMSWMNLIVDALMQVDDPPKEEEVKREAL
jgi:hypothetical protein